MMSPKESPKISVIVPAFNVSESVFEECCRSISEQTETSYEVIVVDDASTASAAEAIEEICSRYGFQLLKNTSNLGVSQTRNRAIEIARGDYLTFIDSDDCVYPDFFEETLELIERTGADCVIGELEFTAPDVYLPSRATEAIDYGLFDGSRLTYVMKGTLAGRDFMPKDVRINHSFVHAGPCGRIYRKTALGDVSFDTSLAIGEDIKFNLDFLAQARACVLVRKTWYQYKQHTASATNNLTREGINAQIRLCSYLCGSDVIAAYRLKQEAYGRILASLKVIIGKGVTRLQIGYFDKRKEVKRLLELASFAEALSSIRLAYFDLSPKDRLFVGLARRRCCGLLLLIFSANAFVEGLRNALLALRRPSYGFGR